MAAQLASEVRKARVRFGVIVSEVLLPGMDGCRQAGDVGHVTTATPRTWPRACGRPSSRSTAMKPPMPPQRAEAARRAPVLRGL